MVFGHATTSHNLLITQNNFIEAGCTQPRCVVGEGVWRSWVVVRWIWSGGFGPVDLARR
jgi:hypothetical protein